MFWSLNFLLCPRHTVLKLTQNVHTNMEFWMPDAIDDPTKLRRGWHDLIRYPHDGLMKGKMDTRIQHKMNLRMVFGQFLAYQRFWKRSRSSHRNGKTQQWSYDGIRWYKMPSRLAQCFYDQIRTFPLSCAHLILVSIRDSVTLHYKHAL